MPPSNHPRLPVMSYDDYCVSFPALVFWVRQLRGGIPTGLRAGFNPLALYESTEGGQRLPRGYGGGASPLRKPQGGWVEPANIQPQMLNLSYTHNIS